MKTTINQDKQKKIIELTPFYSSIEYVYMDKRQKERDIRHRKGIQREKKRKGDKTLRKIREKKRNQTRNFQRTDSLFRMISRLYK